VNHRQCNHVTLAGNEISRVIYCETHDCYELVIGSLSLRLDEASFNGMCNLLSDAQNVRLTMHQAKSNFEIIMKQIKRA